MKQFELVIFIISIDPPLLGRHSRHSLPIVCWIVEKQARRHGRLSGSSMGKQQGDLPRRQIRFNRQI
jgi:hypothetical protein